MTLCCLNKDRCLLTQDMRQDSNERILSNNLGETTGWTDLLRRACVRRAYLQRHGRLNDSCISGKFHRTMSGTRERYCTEDLIFFTSSLLNTLADCRKVTYSCNRKKICFKTLGIFPVAPLFQVMSASSSLLSQTCVSVFPCYFHKLYPYYFRYLQS